MQIGGYHKFSVIDYPEKIAAVIFTIGCNFKCPYCHNPELVLPKCFNQAIPEEEVLRFLKKRQGQLQGVVITGGEPTIQKDLIDFIQKVKSLGYLVKLDTNGSNPDVLAKIIDLHLVDYIAMDIKAPLAKYDVLAGAKINLGNIKRSIHIILNSNIEYQFRTTLLKPFLLSTDLKEITSLIKDTKRYVVQRFLPSDKVLDQSLLQKENYSETEIDELQQTWGRD